ncbi:MAG TPA: metallophosphoesterase family protein [Actinomycetota bacterium]|nr:metallophosphoesterase family protein [Actinomycetota bacterium]
MTTRALVLSDTHVPDFARTLPPALLRELPRADLILHAGDVTSVGLLEELARDAPVHVALGNNDGDDVAAWGAEHEVRLAIEGLGIVMLHDSGPASGRTGRLRRRFPDMDVIVFGHSHIPINESADGLRFLNPGSPTWKRRQPRPTYAWLTVSRRRAWTTIVELG